MAEINSEKYKDIIETAYKLFWKHGIRRISIEEICREAGVSKMTFYRFFSNKKDIAKAVIDKIMDNSENEYNRLMSEHVSFEEKVKKILLAKFENTREISRELIKDIYADEKLGIREHWQIRADRLSQMVFDDFKIAQKEGLIRKDIKIEFLMYFNAKLAEMVSDPELVAQYDNMQDLIMEIANMFFYGILPYKN